MSESPESFEAQRDDDALGVVSDGALERGGEDGPRVRQDLEHVGGERLLADGGHDGERAFAAARERHGGPVPRRHLPGVEPAGLRRSAQRGQRVAGFLQRDGDAGGQTVPAGAVRLDQAQLPVGVVEHRDVGRRESSRRGSEGADPEGA